MADPLCRWRNFTPETICKIVEELPKEEMSISEFREYMQNSTFGDGFFRTVYQYACQLALYYEDSDKKIYIPRFRNNISLEEAKSYLKMWIHKYYVPNPYNNKSSFIDIQPKLLIQSIIEYIEKNGNDDLKNICKNIFCEDIGNVDIIKNVLNKYSDVFNINSSNIVTLQNNYKMIMNNLINRFDKKYFFENFNNNISNNSTLETTQNNSTEICSDKTLCNFIFKVFCELEKVDSLKSFNQFAIKNKCKKDTATTIKFATLDFEPLISILLIATHDEIIARNNTESKITRWFENKKFSFNNNLAYLSTQWQDKENGDLTIDNFSKYLAIAYPNYIIEKKDGSYRLLKKQAYKNILSQSPFSITLIIEAIKSTNLIYSDELIMRFAYSLMAKPFVILSGLAGSGKTQLALTFAKCLAENINEQVCTVSVGADWTNREPLLGYPNALNQEEYIKPENGVLDLLIKANENSTKPYFLILDEMNMSVVERYFADFLSSMESGEKIKLWTKENNNVPTEISLPKNLYIIGTINVDETTYMFSPKVLDRANVIEFKVSEDEMNSFLQEQKPIYKEIAYSKCANMADDFVNKSKENNDLELDSDIKNKLLEFFKALKSVNSEFGYRTLSEMFRYILLSKNDLGIYNSIDTAILQKMLPKLHGSKKKLSKTIDTLWKLCYESNPKDISNDSDAKQDNILYKESADKILRMYHTMIDNGFTSFAEA